LKARRESGYQRQTAEHDGGEDQIHHLQAKGREQAGQRQQAKHP
jgi:hypothetical protein